jgi:dihydroorotate dehydrogenase electron transfer subunit
MRLEQARVLSQTPLGADFSMLEMEAPQIAALAKPGQFIHVQVPNLQGTALRRPFSLFAAEDSNLRVLYKAVGEGTRAMQRLAKGDTLSILGPLGNGFPMPAAKTLPVLVAGGYGVAPLHFLATRIPSKGVVLIGGASASSILADTDFKVMKWDVRIATEDGSVGNRGLVTALLDEWVATHGKVVPVFYCCGPDGLLKAVGQRAQAGNWQAWLSLDKHMGCGAGVCLACVQRVRREGSETWLRVCKDGPVFESREIVWEPAR